MQPLDVDKFLMFLFFEWTSRLSVVQEESKTVTVSYLYIKLVNTSHFHEYKLVALNSLSSGTASVQLLQSKPFC